MLVVSASFYSRAQDTRGFKFNNLTVSPFVNLDYAYDSNVNFNRARGAGLGASQGSEVGDSILTVNPGVDLTYIGNDWGLAGNAWWAYDRYAKVDSLSAGRYGESLAFYREAAKRWRFDLRQSYTKSSQNDSIIDGGQGLQREQEQFVLNGSVAYELSERTKATLSGMLSDLTYENRAPLSPLFGWTEYSVSLELARKLTEKSDVLVSGSYRIFSQDSDSTLSADSTEYGLMAGLGSRASKLIRYRVLTGLSLYEFESGEQEVAWTYSVTANWTVNKKVGLSAAGSSFFQPSKTGDGSRAEKVDALSVGVTYRPMKKLTTRLDLAARREEEQVSNGSGGGSTDELFSVRSRVDYELMRYVSIHGGLEYQKFISDQGESDFDQYRATVGMSLRY
jgi:hypothetical protein